MFSLIILVIALIYVLFQIKNTVEDAVDTFKTTVKDFKHQTVDRIESLVSENKMKIASTVGAGLASMVLGRIGSLFGRKKRNQD